ncbi:type ISP restriction/modification enzyme [Streptomyces misionensis]|uniref:type ISP restriction/modification enzyme n=1 Tax=Streptomyces misionensis TaxID=67331 RepID=UPI0036B8AA55
MPIEREAGPLPKPVRAAYRAFDRQWLIPDSRLMHRARHDLWAARIANQIFTIEQNSKPINGGPGLVFASLIPDMDYFKGSEGGRVHPLLHPSGEVNFAPNLLRALSQELGIREISGEDLLAYCAAIVAHPAYTQKFADELTTPGIRVPITRSVDLWNEAVELGRQVIWVQTYGESCADPQNGRPLGNIRYSQGDPRQPLALTAVSELPDTLKYDAARQVVQCGDGTWGPVAADVWSYAVGGKSVVKSWFSYRKNDPGGEKGSPLDELHAPSWSTEWTVEFIDLLTLLTRLRELESEQASLLSRVLDGSVVSTAQLREKVVKFPEGPKDRKPRYSLEAHGNDSIRQALPLTLDDAD